MAQKIGALLVELQANTAAFSADMRNASRAVQTQAAAMSKSLGSVESGITLLTRGLGAVGVALSAVNLTQFTMQSLKAAAELGDMADRLGVNVERLQEYRFAATQAGASIEDMDKALTKFAVVLGDAQRGEEQAQSKLAKLGIHWRDTAGKVRDVDSAWRDFANSIASEKDNAEALAKLADVLGERFGPKLLNSLQQGAAGFDEAGQKAREWGAIMDAEAIAKAKEFDDALDALSMKAKAWAVNAATAAPGLAEQMFRPYISGAEHLIERYKQLANLVARGLSGGGRSAFPVPQTGGGPNIPPGISAPDRISEPGVPAGVMDSGAFGGNPTPRVAPRDPKIAKDNAKAIADAEEMAARDSAEAWEAFNQTLIKQEQERVARHKAMTDAITKQEEMAAEDVQGAFEALNDQQAKLGREIEQIWEETRTPLERFTERMERLDELVKQGAISWETYDRAVEKAKKEMDDAEKQASKTDSTARELGLTFTSAFEDAVVNGEDFRSVLQGVVKDLARIAIRKTLTEPMMEFIDTTIKGMSKTGGGGGLFGFLGGIFGGNAPTNGAAGFATDFANNSGLSSLQMGFAGGTSHAPRGLHWVGEEGPELMNFRGGEQVFPHDDSMAMTRGGTVFIDARGADRQGFEILARQMREMDRTFEERAIASVAVGKARGRI
jgi:ribosomal protein S11